MNAVGDSHAIIPELHLLEYAIVKSEYISYATSALNAERDQKTLTPRTLKPFSDPFDSKGYSDQLISNDMISEVYLEFGRRWREMESTVWLRTLIGKSISSLVACKRLGCSHNVQRCASHLIRPSKSGHEQWW